MTLRFETLGDALVEIGKLAGAKPDVGDGWSVAKVALHCKQSIDASIDGYPAMKPAVIRATVGRFVAWRFLSRGQMSHDLRSPVPGAPALDDDGDTATCLAALQASIDRFQAHEGTLAPHFIFGDLDKVAYDKLHAMHIADHLSAIDYAS